MHNRNIICEYNREKLGLSLVEVFVSISIVAILLSIMIPAVQKSREAARRVQCSSNVRQVANAVIQFEGVHGVIPSGQYYLLLLPFLGEGPLAAMAGTEGLLLAGGHDNGFEIRINQDWDRSNKFVSTLVCPSDGWGDKSKGPLNYVLNGGSSIRMSAADYSADNGVWMRPSTLDRLKFRDVSDGLSQTALVGECLVPSRSLHEYHSAQYAEQSIRSREWATLRQFSPGQEQDFAASCQVAGERQLTARTGILLDWVLGFESEAAYRHIHPPNGFSCKTGAPVLLSYPAATSNHAGGVHVSRCDGSAAFVSESIDLSAWRALGSRNGHESVGDF